MRTVVIAFGLVCLMGAILAQSVGIGTSTPDPSARLDVSDTHRVGEHPYECNRWEQWDAHSVSRYRHIG
jgi:hypothetical protein